MSVCVKNALYLSNLEEVFAFRRREVEGETDEEEKDISREK